MRMKTILCYGDSLTWGSNPDGGGRHPFEFRWPNALGAALGGGVEIITEGLRGRTTAFDDHLSESDRNGARLLPTLLYTHAPVDLVILMLGANDMKPAICGSAVGAMQGMRRLVKICRNDVAHDDIAVRPEVIIVAPPPLCETADAEFAAMFAGGVEQSRMLGSLYADLADETGCGFFDASTVARTSPLDGVHIDAAGTQEIGRALAPMAHLLLGV